MKNSCPECGSHEIHVTQAGARGQEINLLPKVGGFFDTVKFDAYICGDCGYYRLFVPRRYLSDIISKLPKQS